MTKTLDFEVKIRTFKEAMERYQKHFIYKNAGVFIASLIIILQLATLITLIVTSKKIDLLYFIIAFFCAYIITDFINGFAHLYMDNNTNYTSIFGPFIAAFHLHHVQPRYTDRNPFKIYFFESGTKFWLVCYLISLWTLQLSCSFPVFFQYCFVCIGILSSFAEVSHYWAHNSTDKNIIIRFLQRHGVLLSKNHHFIHHISDNKNYAFLNGLTNPLLNKIANYFFNGYKLHADEHAKAYSGIQTRNRR